MGRLLRAVVAFAAAASALQRPPLGGRQPLLARATSREPSQVRDGSDDREGFSPAVVDRDPPVTAAISAAVSYVLFGAVAYDVVVEPDWSLVDATYFAAATVSTVGYGDLSVESDEAKLFTALYCLVGVGVVGAVFGEIVASSLLEAEAGSAEDAVSSLRARTARSLGAVVALIAAATTIFARVEALRPVDAFFFAVSTVSTVGYGDFAPATDAGKILAIPICLVGCSLVLSALSTLAALPFEARRAAQQRFVLAQLGGELDRDELVYIASQASALVDGPPSAAGAPPPACDRSTFALALLVRQDKVGPEDVAACLETFDKLDADGSGILDGADLRRCFATTAAPALRRALLANGTAADLFAAVDVAAAGAVDFGALRAYPAFADVGDASLRRLLSVGDDSGDGRLDADELAAVVDEIARAADAPGD